MYRANRSEAQTQLMDMIAQWKRSDRDASWEGLADALDNIGKYGTATAESFRQAVGLLPGNIQSLYQSCFHTINVFRTSIRLSAPCATLVDCVLLRI